MCPSHPKWTRRAWRATGIERAQTRLFQWRAPQGMRLGGETDPPPGAGEHVNDEEQDAEEAEDLEQARPEEDVAEVADAAAQGTKPPRKTGFGIAAHTSQLQGPP